MCVSLQFAFKIHTPFAPQLSETMCRYQKVSTYHWVLEIDSVFTLLLISHNITFRYHSHASHPHPSRTTPAWNCTRVESNRVELELVEKKSFQSFFLPLAFASIKFFFNGNEIAARFGLSWKFLHTLDDDDPGGKREISENLSQRSN